MKRLLQLNALAIIMCLGMNATAQINDGSFEAGAFAGTWTEASTNFGTPLCDVASCGDCGGACVARTGTFYAWYGGAGAVETGSVEQTVTIPTGTNASIGLWVKIALPGAGLAADRLEVSVDGTVVSTVSALDSAAYTDYALLTIDVSAMADGNAHSLRIEGFQSATTSFNLLVDDVVLAVDGVVVSLFEDVMEPTFKVYPNPAKDVINLTFGQVNGDALVTIIAVDGTIVSKEMMSDVFDTNFAFSTENMENGVYIVEVANEGNVTTERVVVAK